MIYYFFMYIAGFSLLIFYVCIYSHKRFLAIIFLSCNILVRFWYQGYAGLINKEKGYIKTTIIKVVWFLV